MNNDSVQRILPILRIHDTDFYVDLDKLEFRQVDNSKNAISFKDVQDNGNHTQIMYDPTTKNAFQGTWGEMTRREDVVLVNLPAAVDLDFPYVIDRLNKLSEQKFQERQAAKLQKDQVPTDKQTNRQSKGRGI